jgi:hypothetical protein
VKFQVEVLPCNVVVGYQRFGGPCCFHLHFDDTFTVYRILELFASHNVRLSADLRRGYSDPTLEHGACLEFSLLFE